MKTDTRYEIDIFKLRNGQHTYNFDVNDAFFEAFENSPVKKGNGRVEVILEKEERMIQVDMHLSLTIPLECDKTLKPFDYQVEENKEIMYKYGESEEELDEDLYMITRNTQRIDLTHLIYEYVCMAIPMRKIHPDHLDESEEDELIYRSEGSGDQEDDGDDSVDPRWSKLKDLNN